MAQNITTLLDKTVITAAEIEAATNVLNYLYLVHGTGSKRSKRIELGELLLFLSRNTKFSVLKLIKDENTDIPLYWDNDISELVIWDRANNNKVGLPKVHVHGTLEVEKDTIIDAGLSVNKTLTVAQDASFNSNVITHGYQVVENGLDARSKSVFHRINLGSNKSYFEVNTDADINVLLSGTTIEVSKGDIVTVHNTSENSITVNLGTRPGSGGIETKSMTLNALCAMQFMCCLKQTTQSATYVQWVPLGNATVTWA